jgi:hypothetical protein
MVLGLLEVEGALQGDAAAQEQVGAAAQTTGVVSVFMGRSDKHLRDAIAVDIARTRHAAARVA